MSEQRILKPQPGPQTKFLSSPADIVIYGGAAGGGKAAPLDEPVLTPFGFRPMGKIKVGDRVMTPNGISATVIQIHPQGVQQIYRVKFIDGAETRCTAEHLWLTKETHKKNEPWKIRDTAQIIKYLQEGRNNLIIPLIEKPPVFTLARSSGKIKPYTLGCILGDGCTVQSPVTITNPDEEIIEYIKGEGYELKKLQSALYCYSFANFREELNYLRQHKLNCTAESKYVPNGYLYANVEDRLALLQGLMDTDGYADSRGHCYYTTISEKLAKNVQWMVWSLGGKATITSKEGVCYYPNGESKVCSTAYTVYIHLKDNSILFRLPRKKERCEGKQYNGGCSEMGRRIVSVEPCGTAECQCITLDSAEGLYVTKDFIVTHNSFGLLMTPLRHKNVNGFGMTIFRKNFNQIFAQGGLWDEAQKMYSGISGAQVHKGDSSWTFQSDNGISKVSFAHIERDEDLASWQGSQLCCEINTPILMNDGSYKPVKDINMGDVVQTLNGASQVSYAGVIEEKECVLVELPNGEKQIQSTNHSVLTKHGWISYEDIISQQDNDLSACVPKQCRSEQECDEASELKNPVRGKHLSWTQNHHTQMHEFVPKVLRNIRRIHLCAHIENAFHRSYFSEPSQCDCVSRCEQRFPQKYQAYQPLHDSHILGQQLTAEAGPATLDHQAWRETSSCKVQRDRDNCSVWFADLPPVHVLLSLFRRLPRLEQLFHRLAVCALPHGAVSDESPCAQSGKLFADCSTNCSWYFHQYDGQILPLLRNDASVSLQLDDVVLHVPMDLHLCDLDKTQKCSHHVLQYEHPYNGIHLTSNPMPLNYQTIKITPIGKRLVKNITVSTYNHYITKSGLVNKNCGIGFDELTHFSRNIFFYMLSRNRSACGVKPFVRATCNPDANSWVADFISWWIDQDTGYPILERSGQLRWFIRRDDIIYWAATKKELWEQFDLKTPEELAEPKSVTFVMSSVYDNKELLKVNPSYLANLKALGLVEKERLLYGNWKIKPSAGLYFKRSQVGAFLPVVPDDVIQWVRCWDLAASEKTEKGNPAYTAGVLIGKRKNGRYIIADVVNRQMSASDVRQTIKHTAEQDTARYKRVRIRIPQDPGQAGKEQAASYIKFLSGYDVTAVLESGSKVTRAEPMSAQWQAGNFDIVVADWNEPYLSQLENFPDGQFKDMVDASANGFAEVELRAKFNLGSLL